MLAGRARLMARILAVIAASIASDSAAIAHHHNDAFKGTFEPLSLYSLGAVESDMAWFDPDGEAGLGVVADGSVALGAAGDGLETGAFTEGRGRVVALWLGATRRIVLGAIWPPAVAELLLS